MCPPLLRIPPATAALLVLAGCAAAPSVPADVDAPGMPNAELALRDSVRQVDAEMASLGTMVPARPVAQAEPLPVVPAELQKIVSFEWHGPLDGAVRKLADSVGYTVSISAPEPASELPVEMSPRREQIFQMLQQLGEAVGGHATVELDPLHHQITVIHHV